MNKDWVLTQEAFDRLLAWLGPDRDRSGKKYEAIRQRLIKLFSCRGCPDAEDLADETINRVTKKLDEIEQTYTGDPALYFYGVANRVYLEFLRRKPKLPPSPPVMVAEVQESVNHEYDCLQQCMGQLTSVNRDLVLQYYQEDKRAKIEHRKRLAFSLGIPVNALRIRAHRIRSTLQECVLDCMDQMSRMK